jgi:hypothetical protein
MATYRGSPSGPALPNNGKLIASIDCNENDGPVPAGGLTWTCDFEKGKTYFLIVSANLVCPAPPGDVSAAVGVYITGGVPFAPVIMCSVPAITTAAGAAEPTLLTVQGLFTAAEDYTGVNMLGVENTWIAISTPASRRLTVWEV